MNNAKKLLFTALMVSLSAGTLVGCGGGAADVRATTVSKGRNCRT